MGNKNVIAATTKKKINEGPNKAAAGMLRKLSMDPMINRIKTNTLIIWGEDDPNAPLFIGKEMAELITNCQLEILKNTGHNIQLENPNILYGLVKKFITQTQ